MLKFKAMAVISIMVATLSCNSKNATEFTVNANLKGLNDQNAYIEEIHFTGKAMTEVLDTTAVKNGQFNFNVKASHEGLYRIRFEKENAFLFVVNDEPLVKIDGNFNPNQIQTENFNTPANQELKKFIQELSNRSMALDSMARKTQALAGSGLEGHVMDSLIQVAQKEQEQYKNESDAYLLNVANTSKDPIVSMFAITVGGGINKDAIKNAVGGLTKRFPDNTTVTGFVKEFNGMLTQQEKPPAPAAGIPDVGSMAPDFTMNDVDGKPFSLSQLKGKYVLVDFWASWCGPCRGENPNVVKAYNKYKDKNFTVLGVSLDEEKSKWLEAIQEDHLTWKHISDLKGWSSAAVSLYGFDGIPYNVLIDPQGKIIAKELREDALEEMLSKTLGTASGK